MSHRPIDYCYTADQCEGRLKTLVRGVKRVAEHNAKTGNAPKKHPFKDELEFYSERLNVKPMYLVISNGTFENYDESLEEGSEEGQSQSPVPVPAKKKCSNISVSWMYLRWLPTLFNQIKKYKV